METQLNLTKDQELALGVKIQAMLQMKEKLGKESPTSAQQLVIRQGERAARQLVEANLRLVYKLANSFKKRMPLSPDREELYADGMVGLARAVNKYDPTKGNKFSTVATHWIKQAIARGTNNTYRLVRLPENRVSDYMNIIKIQKEFAEANLSTKEVNAIIMERLNITEAKINEIINAAATHASLNKTASGDEEGQELINYTKEISNAQSAEVEVMNGEMSIILDNAIDKLDDLEAEIISSVFKLELPGYTQKTASAIKIDRNISASEYRNALNSGLKKVKEYMDMYGVTFQDFFKD